METHSDSWWSIELPKWLQQKKVYLLLKTGGKNVQTWFYQCKKKKKSFSKGFIIVTGFSYNVTVTLLLYFGTRAYLFSPNKGSCYVSSTRNNCCEFLASYGVTFHSFKKSYFSGYLLPLIHQASMWIPLLKYFSYWFL